jgi:hypothetical protein
VASPVRSFFGGVLVAAGALMFSLSGACTAIGVIVGVSSGGGDIVGLALVIGAVPIGLGFLLFYVGQAMMRAARGQPGSQEGP